MLPGDPWIRTPRVAGAIVRRQRLRDRGPIGRVVAGLFPEREIGRASCRERV